MKKINAFRPLLALLLIFCLVSCSSNVNTFNNGASNTESIINPSNSLDVNSLVYEPIFLIVMSENISDKLKGEFKDAEQYGVCSMASREVMKDLENHMLRNPMNNQNMEYLYSECSYKNKISKEYGTHYSVYDIYKTEDAEIGVLHGTDLICYYYSNQNNEDGVMRLTDAEAKSLADEFLLSAVGNDILSAFDNIAVKTDTSGLFSHIVNYTRLTNGYRTDENMTVYIDKSGTVVGYNGYNVCKYNALKEKFEDDKINTAKMALIDKINSIGLKNVKIYDPIITTDANGELYIKVNFSYEDDYGSVCGETVLVNVK